MIIVPVFFPDGDDTFRATAGRVLRAAPWDFSSEEGIALMQAVLQRSYPLARVVVDHSSVSGSATRTFVDVYRDGVTATGDATRAWLSAVYDRAAQPAYVVTLRLLQEATRAEAVVERAFAELLAGPRADIETAAKSMYASAFRLARAELRADHGLPPGGG